jgi:hypothetical protein
MAEWRLRFGDGFTDYAGSYVNARLKIYGHGFTPGELMIETVEPGGGNITLTWTTPVPILGQTLKDVTSYDLRYIRSDSTDKTDSRWMIRRGVGSVDDRTFKLTGLSGAVEYDVQIRAVNEDDPGRWSPIETLTTTDFPPGAPGRPSIAASGGHAGDD